jgi:Glycosyltransferase sugar-binding region containing DXD motif
MRDSNGNSIVPPVANNVDCITSGLLQDHHYHQRRPQPQVTTLNTPTRPTARVASWSKKQKNHRRSLNTITTAMRKKGLLTFSIVLVVGVVWFIGSRYWLVTNHYQFSQFETLGITKPDVILLSSPIKPQKDGDNNGIDRPPRNTKIPNILIFTHYVNLVTTNFDLLEKKDDTNAKKNNNDTSRRYTDEELNELRVLQQNVYRIISLHTVDDIKNDNIDPTIYDAVDRSNHFDIRNNDNKNITIRFLTDDDCIQSIRQWAFLSSRRNHTDILHQNNTTSPNLEPNNLADELISYFHKEHMGMYKADLCRGVALYETGGIYMDVDLGPRMNIFNLLLESSEFVTVKVHSQSRYLGAFFQAFIAVTKYHDVIHRYIQLFILHYRRTIQVGKGPIGVILLKRAYDEIQLEQEFVLQQQQREFKKEKSSSTRITLSSSTPALLTHLEQTTELWQEILYLPQYHDSIFAHVPIPTWGKSRRACKFVVAIPPSSVSLRPQSIDSNDTTTTTKLFTKQLIVPMYSRIAGSRMCPE